MSMGPTGTTDATPGGKRPVLLFLLSACLPVLLYSFTLRLPPMCDDHFGYAALSGNLYTVGDEYRIDKVIDPEIVREYPQIVPWWASPDVKLVFLRPLTNFIFQWEYRIFGNTSSAPYHLTSVVLNGLSCAILFLLGRLLLRNDRVALLGTFIFACHPALVIVVPWVADQASILCLLFWLSGLYAHIRFRKGGAKRWEVLAWICFVLSLNARESGAVCMGTYFLYDVFIWRKEDPERWTGIIRIGLYYVVFSLPLWIFVGYFVAHDYGVNGFYSIFDEKGPLLDALFYIGKNLLLYVAGMLFFVPGLHIVNLKLFQDPLYIALGAVVLALALGLFYPGMRKKLLKDSMNAFLCAWMFVALLPTLPLLTQGRYLYTALAPFGLFMARYLCRIRESSAFGRRTRLVTYALIFFYLVFPVTAIWGLELAKDVVYKAHSFQARVVKETRALLGRSPTPANVFYLNMATPLLTFALQYAFDFYGEKGDTRVFPLVITRVVPEVRVLDDHSLLITSRSNPFLESEAERLFMTDSLSRKGAVRSNKYFKATVEKVEEGHIYAVRFDFVTPLDADTMHFFYMKGHHAHPARLLRDKDGRLRFDIPSG